jgi:hypothetical protein
VPNSVLCQKKLRSCCPLIAKESPSLFLTSMLRLCFIGLRRGPRRNMKAADAVVLRPVTPKYRGVTLPIFYLSDEIDLGRQEVRGGVDMQHLEF